MVDTNIRFDLPTLLRMGDLNIRNIAQKDLMLTVGKYNSMLSKLKTDGPRVLTAMNKIASSVANKDDYQSVMNMKLLLEDIGCNKLILILSDIITAIRKGNMDFAADCTKSITDQFSELYNRIVSAERSESITNVLSSDDSTNEIKTVPFSAQPLIKILDRIDREEDTRKLRILAVDDSPVVLKTITSILNVDYKVYAMTNPMMVEKFLEQIVPELFILDYKMPERTGFELIPVIRSFREHEKTPIIILTAMGTIDAISASHSLGACDFIVKPPQESILREKVARHIVKKKLY